ncbi:hypothetical protein OUZ56_024137 [Daphnia magna]|uniref:Uncharacterized protein n=1 Tax=Daphnia magna TaxID=35525 RepID=A0ABR0B088_9CRUS|nr:hypothetical protein OUZ56_024137 [Daphnia magna]
MTEEQSAISNITIQPKDLTQSTSNSIQESRKKILGRIHLIEKGITISKPFKGANQFDLEFETKKIMKSAPELFQRVQQSLGKDNSIPRDISEDSG